MGGMIPTGAPPGGPPPGAGAPPPGPPQPPPPAPPPGLMPPARPPQSPFAGVDMPSELPGGWQMLDGVCRQLKLTIRMPDFAKTPKTVAVLYSVLETLTELISHYTSKGDGGGAPTSVAPESEDRGGESDAHFVSADADAIPPPESAS
jgi:hypothetical protein